MRQVETAVILAGGYGKRLRPHTEQLPKPLLSAAGEPVINSLFHALRVAGIHRVVVVIGHLGQLLERYIKTIFSSEFELSFVRQEPLLGSADALLQAEKILRAINQSHYLVVAADYQLPEDYLQEFLEFHCLGAQQISLSLREIEAERVGESSLVDFGEGGEILRINEKPEHVGERPQLLAASLIYILPLAVLDYLGDEGMSRRGEKELPEVINRMITGGITARGLVQERLADWEAPYRRELL